MGHPPCCSVPHAGMWGKRGSVEGSTLYASLSSIALLPWLPGVPPQTFPPYQSPPLHPLDQSFTVYSSPRPGISPQSLNLSSQLLYSQGTIIPVQGVYGCGKDCLILILFRLPRISCYTLSLSPLTQTIAPMWGSDPCFSSPTHQGQVQSY